MILEIALLNVTPGKEEAFEKAFQEAEGIISSIEGYLSHSLKKSAEINNRYLLQVEWRSIDDHRINFRKSDKYKVWKKMLHPFYNPVPKVEYFLTE